MTIIVFKRKRIGRTLLRLLVACAALYLCAPTNAQVRLPNVLTPGLPPIQLPIEPGATLNVATDALNPERLRDLRQLRIRALLRANRIELAADPNGAPIVRGEIIAYDLSESARRDATVTNFTVARESTLNGLGITVTILALPPRTSIQQALRRLQRADPNGRYDYNHIYTESGMVGEAVTTLQTRSGTVRDSGTVGLIDTGIERAHPSLRSARVQQWGCEIPVLAAHGTAVASLLVGQEQNFAGAAPTGSLFAADVYCGKATGGSIEKIAAAFAWLSEQRVPVINVSLVLLCQVALKRAVRRCNGLKNTLVLPCTLRFFRPLRLTLQRLIAT